MVASAAGLRRNPVERFEHAHPPPFEIFDVAQAADAFLEVVLAPVLAASESRSRAHRRDNAHPVRERSVAKLALQLRPLDQIVPGLERAGPARPFASAAASPRRAAPPNIGKARWPAPFRPSPAHPSRRGFRQRHVRVVLMVIIEVDRLRSPAAAAMRRRPLRSCRVQGLRRIRPWWRSRPCRVSPDRASANCR